MKIVIINKSDNIGGAAVVSYRLMSALRDEGIKTDMLVMEASNPDSIGITEYGNSLRGKLGFYTERLDIFAHNHFSRKNLFKVSTAKYGFDLSQHPLVREADVILLGWINQGAMSMGGLEKLCRLGKPIFYTMHDMWQCTGICHHALDCNHYKNECGECPFLGSHSKHDLSHSTFLKKQQLYAHSNIHFIAVSQWLADKCKESSLLRNHQISVIPNPSPIHLFSSKRNKNIASIPADKKVVVMGAARLDDPIKGFQYAIEAFNIIAENHREIASKLHIVLYGTIRDKSLIERIKLPVTLIGTLNGATEIADTYSRADVVLSTSLFETLGMTLIEGMAAGCIPVTFGEGGQTDVVKHKHTGYIAKYKSPDDIADGITWAVTSPISRESLHDYAETHFSNHAIAAKYLHAIALGSKKR